MEQGLIFKFDWITLKNEVIPEARNLGNTLEKLHRTYTKLSYKIKDFSSTKEQYEYNLVTEKLFESVELLHESISDFLSLCRLSAEKLNIKEDFTIKRIEGDLTNVSNELHSQINNLSAKSYEKVTPFNLYQISEIVARIVNSLIAPSIIEAFNKSRRIEERKVLVKIVNEDKLRNSLEGFRDEFDRDTYETKNIRIYSKNKFLKTFFDEAKNRSGLNPLMRLFKAGKTINAPLLTPSDKKGLLAGVVDELKQGSETITDLELEPSLLDLDDDEESDDEDGDDEDGDDEEAEDEKETTEQET